MPPLGRALRSATLGARALALATLLATPACSKADASEALPAVRLGMSPRDVRDRFESGTPGAWQTKLGATPTDDTVLEWTAKDPAEARVPSARFEFHLGMLVAVRASLREPVGSEAVAATEKTVSVRAPAAKGSTLTVLARDCPTHRDEAEQAARRASR